MASTSRSGPRPGRGGVGQGRLGALGDHRPGLAARDHRPAGGDRRRAVRTLGRGRGRGADAGRLHWPCPGRGRPGGRLRTRAGRPHRRRDRGDRPWPRSAPVPGRAARLVPVDPPVPALRGTGPRRPAARVPGPRRGPVRARPGRRIGGGPVPVRVATRQDGRGPRPRRHRVPLPARVRGVGAPDGPAPACPMEPGLPGPRRGAGRTTRGGAQRAGCRRRTRRPPHPGHGHRRPRGTGLGGGLGRGPAPRRRDLPGRGRPRGAYRRPRRAGRRVAQPGPDGPGGGGRRTPWPRSPRRSAATFAPAEARHAAALAAGDPEELTAVAHSFEAMEAHLLAAEAAVDAAVAWSKAGDQRKGHGHRGAGRPRWWTAARTP